MTTLPALALWIFFPLATLTQVPPPGPQTPPDAGGATPLDFPSDQAIAGGRPIPGSKPLQDPVTSNLTRRPGPWSFSMRGGVGWERNPRFLPGATDSTLVERATLGLSHQRQSPLWASMVSAGLNGWHYRDAGDLSHFGGGVNTNVSYKLSPYSTLTVGDSVELTYAGSSTLLDASGVLLGQVRTFTNVASAGLTRALGTRTALAVDMQHEYVNFDTPDYVDGSQLVASATLSQRTSQVTTLGASYLLGHSLTSLVPGTTHTGYGSWNRSFGTNWTAGTSLGATYSTMSKVVRPYAVGQVTAQYGRTIFSLRGSNYVSQSYGLGFEQEVTLVGGSVKHLVGRRLTLSAFYDYSMSRDMPDRGLRFTSSTYGGSVWLRLTKGLGVLGSAHSSLLRDELGTGADTRASRVEVAIAYDARYR